ADRGARPHQGRAQHGELALGGILAGDDAGADRSRHFGQGRPAAWPEGKRAHRQADPRRDRPRLLPEAARGIVQDVRGAPATGPRHQLARPEHQGATPPGGPFSFPYSPAAPARASSPLRLSASVRMWEINQETIWRRRMTRERG